MSLAALVWAWMSAGETHAQSGPPGLPVGPFDAPLPTPAPLPPFVYPPWQEPIPPPFTAPLPPAVPLPPPVGVPEAVPPPPPPEIEPFDLLPSVPGPIPPPPPNLLPERPDGAEPPAGGLRQGLSEYDRRLGMGGAGAIVSLARTVAMGHIATGSATLEVIADRTGSIRSVRLVDVDGEPARWEDFARALRNTRTPSMRVTEATRGVWMRLWVSANIERASGHRRWWSPGVFLAFDIADTSGRRQRVVQTSVLSQVWF